MDKSCGKIWRDSRGVHSFVKETCRNEANWKMCGSTALHGSWERDDGTCVGYINLVQNGYNWQTLVKREESAYSIIS
jgi:hypothetical protein